MDEAHPAGSPAGIPMGAGAGRPAYLLAEFLAVVSRFEEEKAAACGGLDAAAGALGATAASLVSGRRLLAAQGLPQDPALDERLMDSSPGGPNTVRTAAGETLYVASVSVDTQPPATMVLARPSPFSTDETDLLWGMGRALGMTLRSLTVLEAERRAREESELQAELNAQLLATLSERQSLVERMSKVQRSISHGDPLQEVLDGITRALADLLHVDMVGMRFIDPEDVTSLMLVSSVGLNEELRRRLRHGRVTEGVSGRSIVENTLVVIEGYESDPDAIAALSRHNVRAAMAAPVHENGEVVGALSVGTSERTSFTRTEQDILLAFAEHASLALTDARLVDSMRKAEHAKEMFFAMVSHELKTPLTVIMAALRTMEVHSASLPEEMRVELLASAYERAKDLQKLIDRLLHSGRAELAGERVQVALPDVVAAAIRGFDKSRRVQVDPVPEIRVEIDAEAVREVAGILLENALSHSEPDADISVKAGFGGGHFEFTVDNPGTLTDEELRNLFAPFQRGSRAQSRGVGLGLYIAARLARAMSGDVHVDTSNGRVSFTLRIPCRTVDIRPPAVPNSRRQAPAHPSG